MGTADEIGNRGQWLAAIRLTDYRSDAGAFFRPHFLGDKCPTFDYFVELAGIAEPIPFFFMQVKGTRHGCIKGRIARRLKVKIAATDVRKMALYPAPTYVVGVDEVNEAGYLLAVHGAMTRAISTLPTLYPLNEANLKLLWEEVHVYWQGHDPARKASRFVLED